MTFDPTNTKDWQQVGSGVYLLEETGRYRNGQPETENRYSITVASKRHEDRLGEFAIARRICEALNGANVQAEPTWQTERPTPGDWWLSIATERRIGGQLFPAVIAVTVFGCDQVKYAEGGDLLDMNDSWFDGALWLPRETPADPFAKE